MADAEEYFVCECFFTHNIFLKEYESHVVFESEQQFRSDYKRALYNRGCETDGQWLKVLEQVQGEIERRRMMGRDAQKRKKIIAANYKPLHPHLYILQESFLADSFLSLVEYARDNEEATTAGLLSLVKQCDAKKVYTFQVFTPEFCQEFIEEIKNFESTDLPKGRPNTMNNYGILLNEVGFDNGFFSPLRTNFLMPITRILYPECGGDCLDSHKAFTVHYKMGEDLDLSYHYDNAEVTLNVSLGKEFSGGELYFGDMRQVPLKETECSQCEHTPSFGLLHRGQHMHGALPIHTGERINLIIWMQSSSVRNKLCPMCDMQPRLVSCFGTGDGFTTRQTVPVCSTL